MQTLMQDLRYALRELAKSPGLAATAVISLALGIGANTTIFTLINAVFLNPLPVSRVSEPLAVLTVDSTNPGVWTVSYPNYRDFRDENQVFSGLAAYSFPNLLAMSASGEQPEQNFAEFVSGNYFDVLGLEPALGRFFLPEEDKTPGSHPVVVLGHGLWTRRFGGDRQLLGSVVRLNGHPFTIVGVAPAGFKGLTVLLGPDLWAPAMMQEQLAAAQFRDFLRSASALLQRLRTASCRSESRAGRSQRRRHCRLSGAGISGAKQGAFGQGDAARRGDGVPRLPECVRPGRIRAQHHRRPGLLIAFSNVANLMLGKAVARQKEVAIRLSLEAGRWRPWFRQLLTESTVLGLLGGAVGLVVAYLGRDFIWSFRPAFLANNILELRLGARVFVFTRVISLGTGLLFGLVPALFRPRASAWSKFSRTRPEPWADRDA
jgi:predicted permease